MKVLFVTRSSIFSVPGGDTVQMENTALELKKHNVFVDVYDGESTLDYSQYDFLHFFNITRPAIILDQIKKSNLPFVLSPIYVEYDFYRELPGFGIMKTLVKILGKDGIEYCKILVKHILRKERVEYFPYFFLGQKRSIKRILKRSSVLLPNSQNEYNRILGRYGVSKPYKVVPNGVDLSKFKLHSDIVREKNSVLCAALIEPRKNQLNLIKALNNTKFSLTIVGSPAPNHLDYLELCKKEAGANVKIISKRLPQEDLMLLYQENEVHVLASWFETTGLSSLEAAYMGCKLVVTKCGDTIDYFQDYVEYCKPGSTHSIHEAAVLASENSFSNILKLKIEEKYNWNYAAKCTFDAYEMMDND
jgi:glycosyltransferase involved in cell wall biosynthesis